MAPARGLALLAATLLLAGCWTDAATRLAYDLERGAGQVGASEGATHAVVHPAPSKAGECVGPYQVQLDRVGAIIVWCKDASGAATVSSHSTSYHGRYVDTPETHLVNKRAGEPLTVMLERRGGRVVVAGVR
jgi:hypothetical protein